MQKYYPKKRWLNKLKTSLLLLMMVCFAGAAQAQNVYMHTGSMTVSSSGTINFYDSGGESHGPDYYWERWFQPNEEFTYTFNPAETGKKIKVTFNEFTAYSDNGGTNHAIGSNWSLRLNTAELSIYDGAEVNPDNLITRYTGNMTGAFSVVANGPITFYFHSYNYREEGWQATVQCVDSYELQMPQISFEVCSDAIVINANNKGAVVYYQLNNEPDTNDPLQGNPTQYQGPFQVEPGTKIYAFAKVGEDFSACASKEFTDNDVTPTPGEPTITRELNTITMTPAALPPTINETYYVWYTTDGTTPSATNGIRYNGPFEWNTPNTVFKAVTRALSCSDKMSAVVSFNFVNVKVPTPTIDFDNGNATIACTMSPVTIYYTKDGSTPTTSSAVYTGSFAVSYGTTVKAIAVKGQAGFENSEVASKIYVPEGGSGIGGGVVVLDDREDHSWSYYSDPDQPIHSLNPADVKITYFGNGTGTVSTTDGETPANDSWTANATGVQVGPNEAGNQFVYLKTLENAKANGTGNYPYTMIPNPFSKRPMYSNVVATRNIYVRGTIQDYANGYIIVTYTNVNNVQSTWGGRIYYDGNHSVYPEANLQVLAGTTLSFSLYTDWAQGNGRISCEIRYDNAGGTMIWNPSAYGSNSQSNPVTGSTTVQEGGSSGGSVTFNDYRGFYAWRVKRLSSGLEIQRANGNTVNVDDMVYAEEAIKFVTSKEDGNEVDFEALWAKAYVATYDSDNAVTVTNTAVGFERNFVVLARNNNDFVLGGDNNRLNNPNNRAVTISSYYPDGTVGANRCGIDFGGDLDLNYDLKLEYVQNNDYANSEYYINANGHYLCIGRGMTTNSTIAAQINAIRRPTNGDIVTIDASNTRIRLESGNYGHIEVLAGEYGAEGQSGLRFHTLMTFGTDYDRATKTNDKLTVAPTNGEITFGNRWPIVGENGERRINAPINKSERTFTCITKSGKFQEDQFENTIGSNTQSFYIGTTAESNSYSGKRYLTVEGGEFACIAGGRGPKAEGDDNTYPTTTEQYVDRNDTTATIRIKKGAIIHGGVYGGAAASAAWGHRKIIITGGTIEGWVAGGCNGTQQKDYGGRGIGDAYIYVGGNAIIGGETPNTIPVGTDDQGNPIPGTIGGNIFGTGRGSYGGESVPSSMENSYVVIADSCDILHSVYGGGNLGRVFEGEGHAANVYILGGTIHENVYGGANLANSQMAFVHIKDGVVEGSVYGGSNTEGTANGLAQINMSGGSVGGSVFGGGYGVSTNMNAGTEVNISGGTISHNVYGGGEEGTVTSNTYVNFSGGTVQNVFGAGKGVAGGSTAQITGQTNATVSGGTVNESVYGGGENGDVVKSGELASIVTVSGGNIVGDVFGGGRMGTTNGNTEVDIKGGIIRGNVFGGAYGSSGSVYVAGSHSVNIMGGRIFTNVYGGSRNANDALSFTGYNTSEKAMISVVNISAGQVDEQVYAGGYFGRIYGSVYVFVGKEAILHAPDHAPSFGNESENMYKTGKLLLAYNVWAGSDFGSFSGGTFSPSNISGYSDIYVDGEGYDTETSDESAPSYMNIKGSLLGCGTSGDAGSQGRGIYVRNYGHVNSGSKDNFQEPFSDATRTLFSIQRADTLVIDNSHLNFTGQSKVNSIDATEKYAIYSFDKTVRMTSGSSIFLNAPVTRIIDFWSATVNDLYKGINAVYQPIAYGGLGATGGPIDNKIRVNGGNYIEIYHDHMTYENGTVAAGYGMLNGFAHMMTGLNSDDNICAYARPKQSKDEGNQIDPTLDNPLDGGWVSYDATKNNFSAGTLTNNAFAETSDAPGEVTSGGVQMPYENHTTTSKAGEKYFRIWRDGGMYSEREGVINAYADGTESFNYVDVTIKLPAWRSSSAYYKFQTSGEGANLNTTVDYGPDVMTFATAIASMTDNTQNWIHFVENGDQQLAGADATAQDQINQNPNINFGLVTLAGEGMSLSSPVATQGGLIVCPESDQFLASVGDNGTVNRFNCSDNTVEPQVTFRLTYSNQISTNMTWDPMYVTLVQCDANGNITDIVKISLTINTFTTIGNVFTTQTYAMMDGQHLKADLYTAKVILPTFTLHDYTAEHLSEFYLTEVTFVPNGKDATQQTCWLPKGGENSGYDFTHFAMEIAASRNADNSDGWNGTSTGTHDSHDDFGSSGLKLGETSARSPFAFDFILTYNGYNNGATFHEDSEHPALLGVLTFKFKFTNYANGDPDDDYSQILTINVQVIRRGVGNVFYLDGQNGSNANSALYPNDAALSLNYIFNRCGYQPGDLIYIVNTVDVTKNLEWSGSAYNGVTIYRYPGGHPQTSKQKKDAHGNFLYTIPETGEQTTEPMTNGVANEPIMFVPPIVGNEDNEAFTGAMVAVGDKGNLTFRDITLDGHKTDRENPFSSTDTDAGVTSNSPMITVAEGGMLTLTNGSMLQNNNSTANGGAVAVNGGTLMMNNDASIKNNVTSGNGGAVYMAGTMIVSDAVQLIDNTKGTTANNVYLVGQDDVIQIGTSNASDEFGPFTYTQKTDSDGHPLYWTDENQTEMTTDVTDYPVMIPAAQIGVTKTLYGNVDGYTEVVKVETTNEIEWLADPYARPNAIIFRDGGLYQLEKYNDPTYLYWIGTWVTVQYWNPEYDSDQVEGYDPNKFSDHLNNIDTPEELAWLISYVNGLNGATAHPNAVATITADIDMDASIWVPIGNNGTHFKGTFEGNGHVITGIHSILVNDNAAMFGVTEGATIQNTVAVVDFNGNSINKGTFIGTMNGGTLANVEAAGSLEGKANTVNMGGLVGLNNGGTIHSGFAVNTITAEKAETVVGGLVGINGGNLYNSYANVSLGENNVATTLGGLVVVNQADCTVENCYVINPIGPAFAATNNGAINYCYAADGTTDFVGADSEEPAGHGTYDVVKARKEIGYMYDDNKVTAATADTTYIRSKIVYDGGKIATWPGLLSTLNQWVVDNPKNLNPVPTTWYRSTSSYKEGETVKAYINGDLPVLGFPSDNSMATEDGKFLYYGSNIDANGLDNLFTVYNGKTANMFLYGNATDVTLGNGSNPLFINEDAVLLQKATDGNTPDITATVGVTFDNSCGDGVATNTGAPLTYDWHFMSTPLQNAPINATYGAETSFMNPANIESMDANCYFPNGLFDQSAVTWDFYTYSEEFHHWVNLKRTDHYYQENGQSFTYVNETSFEPGKGYMMAISQDSYMNSTGLLNNDDVPVTITNKESQHLDTEYNEGWNLVGNPYQGYLDLMALFDADVNPNASQAYVYDADLKAFTPFVKGASENPTIIERYLHQHQAFFVHSEAENATLTFKPGMATATMPEGYTAPYFRGEGRINYPLVNLFAENTKGNRDLAVIEFNRPELGGATKVNGVRNANFQVAASLEGHRYGLVFTPEGTEKVPVHFTTEENGTFTLTWETLHGDFTSLLLVDNMTGTITDMLRADSYTFDATTDDYASRFYITYAVTGVDEYNEGDGTFAFFDGSAWVVNGKGQLDVVDVQGRTLYSERLVNDKNRVSLNGVSAGVYLLRVSDGTNTMVQKIVVR